MKAGIVFSGSGPILVLTSFASLDDAEFIRRMAVKGIDKFIAYEVDLEKVRKKYGQHYDVIIKDVKQTDDLRVLDHNGFNIMHSFSMKTDVTGPFIKD